MNILVTGAAGFIGFHAALKLISNKKNKIFGIDNFSDYYDIKLKKNRIKILNKYKNFYFSKIDISNQNKMNIFFKKNKIKIVIHLAAQAGVRYSVTNPELYFNSNIDGFFNVLSLCKLFKIKHFLFASSSSVYGDNSKFPLKEEYDSSKPLSFYAATKKCNEVMAYSYANIYKLPSTGLRFFTVYGPYGRPDMALHKFVKSIRNNKKIELYNNANHTRDFTYIDDAINQIIKLINIPPKAKVPYRSVNIASSKPIKLKKYIEIIEQFLKKEGKYLMKNKQIGDVEKTFADTSKIAKKIKYKKKTDLRTGIKNFIDWFNSYYQDK
mgnify:CR=1 FL=1